MIAIKPAKLKDFASLMQLEVFPEQKALHLPFEQIYHNRSKYEVILTLYAEHHPVGYMVVDKSFSHYATFSRRHELGLKYIVLDKHHQKQGHGREAINKLLVYANAIDSSSDSICVTLPANDTASQQFFTTLGFSEEAKLFFGKNGKERIMRHKL
ncbi:GNAT family N-acetyltransferase [Vibrio ponticus]|uniref:GNAT family N-acetyltransferase n=1 Tax=Vibrio ponticus TaxID=265668 RepID=A0ABX3FM87_9VIBR|nr:GNAT family N-acetyltransferase [Vibrio ponticus]OLQ93856.1 GNAT family N-acetyltransferase [Vibrio ponticus]